MELKPSEKRKKITEKYNLGELQIPDYEASGRMDIGVLVIYTKEINELGGEPMKECARFKADCNNDYFTGMSIYGGYIKYTHKNGLMKRMFLSPGGRGEYSRGNEEIEPHNLADPTILNTERWDEEIVRLIDQLPEHVRDLFRFSK